MLRRLLTPLITDRLSINPAVALVGPRQSGKSPKVYWRDSGIQHALSNATDQRSLLGQPWVGATWEGHVIEQALGLLSALGRRFGAHYLRTSDGQGIDFLLELNGELWAIEVKLTASPSPSDMSGLDKAADLVGASRRYLISQAPNPAGDERRASGDLPWLLDRIRKA